MTAWFQFLGRSWLIGDTVPLFVRSGQVGSALHELKDADVTIARVDLAGAESSWEVIMRLKAELPLPGWCGASWDSIDDAFEELRQGLVFPVVLFVDGFDDILTHSQSAALELVVRLAEISKGFSLAGDQFTVLYVGQ